MRHVTPKERINYALTSIRRRMLVRLMCQHETSATTAHKPQQTKAPFTDITRPNPQQDFGYGATQKRAHGS
jgi:hypothetical protein|tara:strand:- start:1110 stop:1322 length:213 start_codon:yes stop_codon:yes gene_type:complete